MIKSTAICELNFIFKIINKKMFSLVDQMINNKLILKKNNFN